jgi:two-component system chemotaxis response regulator CheY
MFKEKIRQANLGHHRNLRFIDARETFRCTGARSHRLPLRWLGSSSNSCGKLPVNKRKVLVVDDFSTIRKIIQHSLRQANLNVGDILEASNGREALGLVQRYTFDLILMDIDMPLMDGLELLEALAYVRSAQNTPVVVITKHTSEEGVLRAMEARARAYIRKPFTVKDLSEKIEPLLVEKLEPAKT